MKSMVLFITISFLLGCKSEDSESVKTEKLKPTHKPIKTKKVFEHSYKFGEPEAEGNFVDEYLYDQHGKLTNEKSIYNGADVSLEYVHLYDSNNKRTKSFLLEFHPFDTLHTHKHYYKNLQRSVVTHISIQSDKFC